MKVATLSTSDSVGGAAIACYRLHSGLNRVGVASTLFAYEKLIEDSSIHLGETNLAELRLLKKRFLNFKMFKYRKSVTQMFSPAVAPSFSFSSRLNKFDSDLVHMHWINGEYFPIEDIAKIKAPIVWSMHDMWPFTGGCHYSNNCIGYQSVCGKCPVLRSLRSRDLSNEVFKRKIKVFDKKNDITFIGLSRWMTDCAKESSLLAGRHIECLPNGIDTNEFKPLDKLLCRQLMGLSDDSKVIAYGAMGGTSDPRKGYSYLKEAITGLEANGEKYEFVIFGGVKRETKILRGCLVHEVGPVRDMFYLRAIYSAADILVMPSIQENLSNTIMESMACGTPVVAFNIGGNSDLITSYKNGVLVNIQETNSLIEGIKWVINHSSYSDLALAAREAIVKNFDIKVIANRYKTLYESVLEG